MQSFGEHTAAMIVSVAWAASPGDPVAVAAHALMMATDPDLPVGPDYERELETADDAAAELEEQEAGG